LVTLWQNSRNECTYLNIYFSKASQPYV